MILKFELIMCIHFVLYFLSLKEMDEKEEREKEQPKLTTYKYIKINRFVLQNIYRVNMNMLAIVYCTVGLGKKKRMEDKMAFKTLSPSLLYIIIIKLLSCKQEH